MTAKPKRLVPHNWLRQDKLGRMTVGQIKWPGMPRVFAPFPAYPQRLYINRCEPLLRPLRDAAEPEVNEAAVKPWLDVYWHVAGWDSAEQWEIGNIILDWLALLLGDLSLKAGWQVIITGPQGLGKDSVMLPLVATLGTFLAQTVQSQQFGTEFNEWAGGRLVQVSETRQNTKGTLTGHDVMNVLKSVFDNSREWMTVNPKYGHKHIARNVVMGWFTSNDREPLRLEPGDRRFLVIDRDGTKPLSQDKYKQLHRWLVTSAPGTNITGIMRVAEFLYRRWDRMDQPRKDVLMGTAPMTDDKRAMLSRLADPIEEWIRRSIARGPNDPKRFPDIVTADYAHSRLETAVKLGGEGLPSRVGVPHVIRIGHYLRAAGAVVLNDGKLVKVNGVPVALWAVRDAVTYKMLPPSDLAKVFTSGTSTKDLFH